MHVVTTNNLTIPKEPPSNIEKNVDPKVIDSVAAGAISAIAAFFALLLLGASISFAAVTSLVVLPIIGVITSLYLSTLKSKPIEPIDRHKPVNVDPFVEQLDAMTNKCLQESNQLLQVVEQLDAMTNKCLQESNQLLQEIKKTAQENEAKAIAQLAQAMEEIELEEKQLEETTKKLVESTEASDPKKNELVQKCLLMQRQLPNMARKQAFFHYASPLILSNEARMRVLAPYRERYSQLIELQE